MSSSYQTGFSLLEFSGFTDSFGRILDGSNPDGEIMLTFIFFDLVKSSDPTAINKNTIPAKIATTQSSITDLKEFEFAFPNPAFEPVGEFPDPGNEFGQFDPPLDEPPLDDPPLDDPPLDDPPFDELEAWLAAEVTVATELVKLKTVTFKYELSNPELYKEFAVS